MNTFIRLPNNSTVEKGSHLELETARLSRGSDEVQVDLRGLNTNDAESAICVALRDANRAGRDGIVVIHEGDSENSRNWLRKNGPGLCRYASGVSCNVEPIPDNPGGTRLVFVRKAQEKRKEVVQRSKLAPEDVGTITQQARVIEGNTNGPLLQIVGDIGNQRGRDNESKVEMAFAVLETRPDWFKNMKKATLQEEARGIDFVIESDVGKLYLQVKSSWRGVREHLDKDNIAIVMIKAADDRDTVVRKCRESLERQRKKYLSFRNSEE